MSAQPPTSPRFSFKGWSFSIWLAKNASFVKTTVSTASGLTGGVAFTDLPALRTAAVVWGGAAFVVAVRAGADALHYFFAENPS